MKKAISDDMIEDLYEVLLSLKSEEECKDLLEDLCTVQEVKKMAQRIRAAKLLINGMTYNQVIEETDISSATLSRVPRCVQYGKGYVNLIKKAEKQ